MRSIARDGAAAGADLDHLDDGHADGQPRALLESVRARHLELACDQRLAPVDDAGLRGGAAHVEGQEPRLAGAPRQRARRRARPPPGPDSTRRMGTRLAVAGVAMPPEDSMM